MFKRKSIKDPVKSVDDFIKKDLEWTSHDDAQKISDEGVVNQESKDFDKRVIEDIIKDIPSNDIEGADSVLKKDDLLKIAERSSKSFFTPTWVGKTIATLLAKKLEKTPMANNKWQFPAISIDGKRTVHYLWYQDSTMVLQLIPQKISIDINDIKDEEELRIVDYFITNVL